MAKSEDLQNLFLTAYSLIQVGGIYYHILIYIGSSKALLRRMSLRSWLAPYYPLNNI